MVNWELLKWRRGCWGGGMLRCSLGQPGRSVCVWVSGMRVCTVRYAAAPQAKTVGITSTPRLPSPLRLLPLVLPLLTPPIAIFTLCTCKRNCTNGIISCFLPLPRREAASHFVLFCLSFWFAFVLDSFNFSYPPPLALCKYSSSSSSHSLPALLPCRRFIFLSLTQALIFSLLRAVSVTAKSKQRKAHVVSRRQRRRSLRRRRRCRRRSRKTSKTFLFSFGAFQIIFDWLNY